MAENFTNTSNVKTNSFNKGMVKDYTDLLISEGLWTNAINAINNTHYGEVGTLGNEPSNELCTQTSYTITGFINKRDHEWIICSTNNGDNCDIGIFNELECSYTRLVRAKCLNFRTTHLINGVCKKNYDGTYTFYFADNLNPDRALNLDRIPYICVQTSADDECYTEDCTDQLDCDAIRLHPLVQQPCVKLKKAQGAGQLNNGSYMAVIAYSENGIRLTDYSTPSNPQALWDHSGIGGGLEVNLSQLDQDFEEYELVIISVVNQQTIAKKIGNYTTRQTVVTIDLINQSLPTVDLGLIPLKSVIYEKSEKMFTVNGYLIRTGPTSQPYFNYQPLANQIRVNWVAVEYPANYYFQGGSKTGYLRDEVYTYFIRWVYRTGARSASFHIPGRKATPSDLVVIDSPDVLEAGRNKRWQVYDTATKSAAFSTLSDGGIVVARGQMAYWESTERYPNEKPEVWGELCNQPIRHHKMPGNETVHIHTPDGKKINLLGVEFENIQHPLDEKGNPMTEIVGYEILRGSREGHRSVVAKGLFNNMWEYTIEGTSRKGLYQNYPYNDLREDRFLVTDPDTLEDGCGNCVESPAGPTTYRKDIFSFHSPETSFIKPYLGAGYHVKIYNEEIGTITGKFEVPHKHPRHKFLTDASFITASIVGLGIALLDGLGSARTKGTVDAAPLGAGTRQEVSKESGNATIIPELISNVININGIISIVSGLAVMATNFPYYFSNGADQVLGIIEKLANFHDYVLQYNSHGFYRDFANVNNTQASGSIPSFSRRINGDDVRYIGAGLQDFDATYRINNQYRNKFVALRLTSELPNPHARTDNSRQRVRDVSGISHNKPTKKSFNSTTVAYYGAIKVDFQNQYGQLSTIVQLPTDSCVYASNTTYPVTSPVVFGGDVYINRFTEKNPYYFFNDWQYDMPDGTSYDYRNYVNGPTPRYWAHFARFDMSQPFVTLSWDFPNDILPSIDWNTPSDYHRLDRGSTTGLFVLKHAFMYLFYNGVRDFFTESELNMAFRDYGEQDHEKFYDVYGDSFSDLSLMFRSDQITEPTYYKYDLSLSASKLSNNFQTWGKLLPKDYDPTVYNTQFEYYPNRAIYSLQQQSGLRRDNWKNFLPLNYKDFSGRINNIKSLNATGAIILFENNEPLMFAGSDTLQTEAGVKFTLGDGGLFSQSTQSMVNADDALEYGTCNSLRSAVNTPHGLFWASQKTGKILQYAGGIQEISSNGMKYWFAEHLPSKLLAAYPDYPLYDNPVAGIGVQAVYDPLYELVYFTKKDFIPLRTDLIFDDPSGVPYYICNNNYTPVAPAAPVNQNPPATESGEPQPTACNKPIDLAIVLDTTASMGASINNLKTSLSTIVNDAIVKSNNNYRLALVKVNENSGGPSTNQILCAFANNNQAAFQTALTPVTATGGGAFPEPWDLGIQSILNGDAGAFRASAHKIIIVITDDFPSGGNDAYTGADTTFVNGLATQAATDGVLIYPVRTPRSFPFTSGETAAIDALLNNLADTTGGVYAISSDGSVSSFIQTAIADTPCPLTCSLSASATSISAGSQVTLNWNTSGARSVTLNNGIGNVALSGNMTITPLGTTTYVLTAQNGDSTTTCSVTITVTPLEVKCPCAFDNPECFTPCHWTISYDPKNKMWISFHDWHPNLLMPSFRHFYSIKNNKIWRHNERWDSYANFYGQDYPWEVEYPVMTPNQITTLRSIEYYMDAYKFFNDGMDKHHALDVNFDRAIIYNSEQISGLLKMQVLGKNAPLDLVNYPNVTANGIEILFSKEENKYRFNQFWDITNDRGEFSGQQIPMWVTACDGYHKVPNPAYINYNKDPLEHKKFRHYGNRIILRKNVSGDKKMILKITNSKHLNSSR